MTPKGQFEIHWSLVTPPRRAKIIIILTLEIIWLKNDNIDGTFFFVGIGKTIPKITWLVFMKLIFFSVGPLLIGKKACLPCGSIFLVYFWQPKAIATVHGKTSVFVSVSPSSKKICHKVTPTAKKIMASGGVGCGTFWPLISSSEKVGLPQVRSWGPRAREQKGKLNKKCFVDRLKLKRYKKQ